MIYMVSKSRLHYLYQTAESVDDYLILSFEVIYQHLSCMLGKVGKLPLMKDAVHVANLADRDLDLLAIEKTITYQYGL